VLITALLFATTLFDTYADGANGNFNGAATPCTAAIPPATGAFACAVLDFFTDS
jgi:hypothetical protein